MSEYTSTTDEVRDGFAYNEWDVFPEEEEKPRRQAFDSWLAEYTREKQAEAWDEGFCSMRGENPYRTGGAE